MNHQPQWDLCALCGQDRKACNGKLGPFLGPLDDGNRNGIGVYIHRECALWSSEVYHSGDGSTLRNVGKAIRRGRQLRCGACGERGATLGCRVDRCNVSYHVHCARACGCAFNEARYLIACPRHAAAFRHEAEEARRGLSAAQWELPGRTPTMAAAARRESPVGRSTPAAWRNLLRRESGGGGQQPPSSGLPAAAGPPPPPPPPAAGGAGRQQEQPLPLPLPQQQRRSSGGGGVEAGAPGWGREEGGRQRPSKRRKIDYTAAAKHLLVARAALLAARHATSAATAAAAAAAEAEDDEAVFAVKERRRYDKDTAKLAPIMLGGGGATGAAAGEGGGAGGGIYSRGFECVGGLQPVIAALHEMVLLPLLHPGLMERLGVAGAAPPRGILLHGLPGTG
ncbi:hypothetical protein Agub_g1307, partial [Astrephomene gubernaculifera]